MMAFLNGFCNASLKDNILERHGAFFVSSPNDDYVDENDDYDGSNVDDVGVESDRKQLFYPEAR